MCETVREREGGRDQREENMDRGVVHKSSAALVREMGEAGHSHGWWSMNNLLRPPFEQQHHASLFMPSTTTSSSTAAAAPSSSSSSPPLQSFSSLLLSNHYPLPTTTSTSPWQHDSSSTSSHGQPDSWSQLIQYVIHFTLHSLSPLSPSLKSLVCVCVTV